MKYDDATWHSGGDFPTDLPAEAGATHAGMYLAWLLLKGMAGEACEEDLAADLRSLVDRAVTPGQFLLSASDGKFVAELINDEANAFTLAYYDADDGQFVDDYEQALAQDLPSIYHVSDTWERFDTLAPVLEKRLLEWQLRSR